MGRALQTAIWFRDAQWTLDQCHRRFGPTFSLRIANQGTWVVLTDPADVRRVFTGDPGVLHAGEGNAILEPVLGNRSVLLLDGAEHLEQRKLMLPAFHGERMARYGRLMADVAAAEIDRWPDEEVQRLRPRMQALTLEIILLAVLGVTDRRRRDELRVALRRLLTTLTDPRRAPLLMALGPHVERFGPFRRDRDRVDRLLYAEIAARREGGVAGREDILSLLIVARHDDGSPMTDRELRDQLLTLLVAGHETTANALAWACERLARHPDAYRRLADETAAGSDTYLRAVVQETLRLRPVISIVGRVLQAPMHIAGYDVPAGTTVAPCIYLLHRRPDLYPDPERFVPERFLERPPGTYTWIPFGGGVRRCLGAAFAQFEMETVLRELVTRTVIRPTRPEAEPVLRRAVTETPRHDAEVVVARQTGQRASTADACTSPPSESSTQRIGPSA